MGVYESIYNKNFFRVNIAQDGVFKWHVLMQQKLNNLKRVA